MRLQGYIHFTSRHAQYFPFQDSADGEAEAASAALMSELSQVEQSIASIRSSLLQMRDAVRHLDGQFEVKSQQLRQKQKIAGVDAAEAIPKLTVGFFSVPLGKDFFC